MFCIFIFMNLSCKLANVSRAVVLLNTVRGYHNESEQNMYAKSAYDTLPMRWLVELTGVTHSTNPINDECTLCTL